MFKIITDNFVPITIFPIVVNADEIVSQIKENNLSYSTLQFIKERFIEEYNPICFNMRKIDSSYYGKFSYEIFRINTRSVDNKFYRYDLYLKIPDHIRVQDIIDFNDPSLSKIF